MFVCNIAASFVIRGQAFFKDEQAKFKSAPTSTTKGFKMYVIGGRHTSQLAKDERMRNRLDDKDVYRPAKLFLLSKIGDEGAMILGSADNQQAVDAARYGQGFLDKVTITNPLLLHPMNKRYQNLQCMSSHALSYRM